MLCSFANRPKKANAIETCVYSDTTNADTDTMPTIDETIALIERLFDGVTDKGGAPYAGHCLRVMAGLPATATEDERHAALLHDALEDTPLEVGDLEWRGYSKRTIDLVIMLSRPKGPGRPSYMDWIRQIAATGDSGLIAIKLADNADNSDPARIAQLPPEQQSIADRYARARKILEAAITAAKGA